MSAVVKFVAIDFLPATAAHPALKAVTTIGTASVKITVRFLSCCYQVDDTVEIMVELWVVLHCQHVGSSFDYFVNVGVVKGKISLVFSGFQTCGKSEIVQTAVDFTLVKSRRDGYFAIYTQFRTPKRIR